MDKYLNTDFNSICQPTPILIIQDDNVVNKDIFIIKKSCPSISTGYLDINIPENFELFDVSYSTDYVNSANERTVFAIYTFKKIKIFNKQKGFE